VIKRALISVWNKEGVVELGQFFENNNIEILSTGGTQTVLENAGVKVTSVADITGTGAVMDGRVKTLDPKIFGGILADRNNPSHISDLDSIEGLEIDVVVVNFYPFVDEAVNKKLAFQKAIEFIDIGGPSMIRAAAKNYHSIVPLCNVDLYNEFMNEYLVNKGQIPLDIRQKYACEVFSMTSKYESAIYNFFTKDSEGFSNTINLSLKKAADLRYGENPHQEAAFYVPEGKALPWTQLQGKKLSYNNYADMESAIAMTLEFDEPSCAIIKHANPCGFGLGDSINEAYHRAVSTDPVSYFGGIVAFNKVVDKNTAMDLVKPFLECIIAPEVTREALEVFKKKKNLRVVVVGDSYEPSHESFKSVVGGYLVQEKDSDQGELDKLEIVTDLHPSNDDLKAMKLGWTLVRYVKSNGIVYSNSNQLLAVGAGQMSRVDSVKIGIRKVNEAGLNLDGSILASDAFFPFSDSIELAAAAGVRVIIQPGGSVKDQDVIDKANQLGLVMAFTNKRHFYH
jgi:phosphoribosylaminoimidazolecarboxamide formyltransferase / IMP cyclohydrolase